MLARLESLIDSASNVAGHRAKQTRNVCVAVCEVVGECNLVRALLGSVRVCVCVRACMHAYSLLHRALMQLH